MELFEALNSNLNLNLCVPSGRVTRDHDGVYTCTAHNGVGGSQGAAANISLTVGGDSCSIVYHILYTQVLHPPAVNLTTRLRTVGRDRTRWISHNF